MSQMSIRGDNVTLVCRATSTADAPLHFTWKHDNVELVNANLQTNIGSSESGATEASSVLQLTNVTHANAGKYQCMVTNNYGTTYSAKAKLSVLGKLHVYSFFLIVLIRCTPLLIIIIIHIMNNNHH